MCGNIKYNLRGEKIYECSKCRYKEDRDINGSRNILIKYLTESSHESEIDVETVAERLEGKALDLAPVG